MVCFQWTLTPFALQISLLPVRVSGIRFPRLPSLQRSFVTLPSRRTIKPISALLIKRYPWEILTITSPQNQLILCIRVPQKDLCIATKPMFDFRILKPKKRIATANPLLTLVLFWTGKGHYGRYFYVRPVQKTVSKENCGRNFLRNTSQIVKKKVNLDLYTETQSAYCANHSTETAFLCFSNDINFALDNHDNVFLVLLDSSSAFDKIDKGVIAHPFWVEDFCPSMEWILSG